MTGIETALGKQAIAVLYFLVIYVSSCFYWILIKRQSIIIDRILLNAFRGGLISDWAYNWMSFLSTDSGG